MNDDGYLFDFNCRPSGERGSRNPRNRHLRSSYCCSVYPAVRNSYRALLRSSSIREPSDPPLRVINLFNFEHFEHFQLEIRGLAYDEAKLENQLGRCELVFVRIIAIRKCPGTTLAP